MRAGLCLAVIIQFSREVFEEKWESVKDERMAVISRVRLTWGCGQACSGQWRAFRFIHDTIVAGSNAFSYSFCLS